MTQEQQGGWCSAHGAYSDPWCLKCQAEFAAANRTSSPKSRVYDALLVEVGHMSKRQSTAVFDYVDELRAEIEQLQDALSCCVDVREEQQKEVERLQRELSVTQAERARAQRACEQIGARLPVETTGWRPIETAPSDVKVLLYSPSLHWANLERVEAAVYHDTRGGHKHAWATHWMPLPERPSDKTTGEPSNG